MPFVKGQSGNPKGRRKANLTVLTLCKAQTKANIKTLIAARDDVKAPWTVRVHAATEMLNRAWGTPQQSIAVKNEGMPMFVALLPPTATDADAWAAKAAQLNGGSPKLIEGEFEAAEVVPVPNPISGDVD
jgi:hypothetical protein